MALITGVIICEQWVFQYPIRHHIIKFIAISELIQMFLSFWYLFVGWTAVLLFSNDIFSNGFSLMKISAWWVRSSWNLFQIYPTIIQHLFGQWIGHYNDVLMGVMASQITSLTSVYSTVYSGVDKRKHQSSASLAFVRGIHRGQVQAITRCWQISLSSNGVSMPPCAKFLGIGSFHNR